MLRVMPLLRCCCYPGPGNNSQVSQSVLHIYLYTHLQQQRELQICLHTSCRTLWSVVAVDKGSIGETHTKESEGKQLAMGGEKQLEG